MQRRDFLKTAALGSAGALASVAPYAGSSEPKPDAPKRFQLSSHGCGRATAYAEANKIITHQGKTHVAWLDSADGGFHARVRTLDRATGTWSETYTIGPAHDNHGGPALTIDSQGYLHVVYYPHHHPFRYRRSIRPNDASAWGEEIEFGKRCTYPTLLCGPDDTLYLTCRESDQNPWVVNLYTKPPGGAWQRPRALLRAEQKGYSHYQEALAWGPDHQTIHLSCRIYDGKPGQPRAVGYLTSPDAGKTWQRSDGTPVELPATAKTVTVLADPASESGSLRCGTMAIDPDGKPHVLFSAFGPPGVNAWISSPDRSGTWKRRPVLDALTGPLAGCRTTLPGGLAIGTNGHMYAVVQAIKAGPKADTWGHASNEVVWLESIDAGQTFTARIASIPDPQCSHWLPNIERPTGHNRIATPDFIYTAGPAGPSTREILANGVEWVRMPTPS